MFNPYAVRPIGSDRFLEHLNDIQTERYYATEMPAVEFKVTLHGWLPWREPEAPDPYYSLMMAVIGSAFMEYLNCYERKIRCLKHHDEASYWVWNSACIDLENSYFRRDPGLEVLFDKLLQNVCWEGTQEIEKCKRELSRMLRWTKRANSKDGDQE